MKLHLLSLAVLALGSHTVAADCMRVDLGAALLTPKGATIPADGGILVGWKEVVGGEPNDDPAHPKWQFSTPVVAETLAPSLVVHRPKAAGDLEIKDAKGAQLATFKHDAKSVAVALPAPKISSVAVSAPNQPVRWSRGRSVTVALAGTIPDGAFAIIGYVTRANKPVAIEFAGISDRTAKSIETYRDPGHCGFNPTGLDVPGPGEKMTFAYVDQFGRLSKPSAAVAPVAIKRP